MTINDIARLAGVSITTVSRVINNQSGVRKCNKTRVREIIQRCSYYPDPYARSLGRRNGKRKGF